MVADKNTALLLHTFIRISEIIASMSILSSIFSNPFNRWLNLSRIHWYLTMIDVVDLIRISFRQTYYALFSCSGKGCLAFQGILWQVSPEIQKGNLSDV
jgi:hypothetical protein